MPIWVTRFSMIVAPPASLLISPSHFWRHLNLLRTMRLSIGQNFWLPCAQTIQKQCSGSRKWAAFSEILTIFTLMRHHTNTTLSCNHSFRQYTHIDTIIPFLISCYHTIIHPVISHRRLHLHHFRLIHRIHHPYPYRFIILDQFAPSHKYH